MTHKKKIAAIAIIHYRNYRSGKDEFKEIKYYHVKALDFIPVVCNNMMNS